MSYGNYPDLNGVKKILVLKYRHHGDVLLTSPLFSVLKSRFPEAEIDACIYKETHPMLEGLKTISRFFLYDRAWKKLPLYSRLKKEFSFLRLIRRQGYDLVLNLTEGDRGALVALVSGAPIKVGFDPEDKGFLGKRRLYTRLVKNCKTPRHTVEKNLDVLRCAGIFPREEERDLIFVIPESAKASVEKKLRDLNLEGQSFIVIHPVSRWRFKCWPIEKVSELVRALSDKGKKIILTASPDPEELSMIQEILKGAEGASVYNLAGKLSLKELGALLQRAEGVISVDTVVPHMASALKVPLVVLFGPSSEKNWGPWRHPRSCVVSENLTCRPCFMDGCGGSKKSDCLQAISVVKVLVALEGVIATAPHHSCVKPRLVLVSSQAPEVDC